MQATSRSSFPLWLPPRATPALLFAAFAVACASRGAAAADGPSGQQIYRAKCAVCHGAAGAGTKKYEKPLEGDLSVAELAELIGETMPEDDPGSLKEAESGAVAAWVYDAFYSAIARARNKPARIELARLTVDQHRQALTDLIGSFRQPQTWGDERGLTGEYYAGRRIGRGRRGRGGRETRRIDPQIDFDFGTAAPVEEITEPHEFSIRWQGSLLAPETGEYEFVVRTEHAFRLWINDSDRALVDAWVKSGDETEYKSRLFLIGGRVYPLRLDFTKAKQGVDDSDKQKEKPPSKPASIALIWTRPGNAPEAVPTRFLSPEGLEESFACRAPFPPDDRSYGWVRGTSVSKEWDDATTNAAIETAGYVAAHLNELAGTRDGDSDRREQVRSFCVTFAERAFRRPLTAEQAQSHVDRYFADEEDLENAVKRTVFRVLKSPRFLFREIGGPDDYDVASRLSFGLWDSLPDEELLAAAREGRLKTRAQVTAQAERMLSDLRAKTKLREFLLSWLRLDRAVELSKDEQRFPEFDAAAVADMRTSLELFLDEVVWSDESDYRQLLLSRDVYLNDRLAKLYGVELAADGGFTKVELDDGRRAGVLTHPYLMARLAHDDVSSPIHRGVFLVRGVLGQSLRPPPQAVTPLPPELHPDLTTRERVTLQTKATNCMICHGIINPLGFTLEHFDAIGRYRETDRDKPIDSTGSYRTRGGKTVAIATARELATFLANSDEAQTAFTERLFHHLVQQSVRAYGPGTLEKLRHSFAANRFHIRKLAVEVMAVSALTGRGTQVAALTEEENRGKIASSDPDKADKKSVETPR